MEANRSKQHLLKYAYLGSHALSGLSLNIAKEVGSRAAEGHAYCNLGSDYHSLGEYQQALHYHKQALNIAKKVDD